MNVLDGSLVHGHVGSFSSVIIKSVFLLLINQWLLLDDVIIDSLKIMYCVFVYAVIKQV